MSRILTGVVLFLLLISICAFSVSETKTMTDDLKNDFTELRNSNEINEPIEIIQRKWDKYGKYASAYLNHQDLERLSVIITTLKAVDESRCDSIKLSCDEAVEILDHIWMSELPALYNIL